MDLTRRGFTKLCSTGLIVFASGLTVFITGCGVFSDIQTWVPVGLAALQGILTALGPLVSPGAAQIVSLIKIGFADLVATVNAYTSDTNPADKATLVAKIRTILNDIVKGFQDLLVALNLANNPIEVVVVDLANVILSALAGFLSQLPVPAGGPVGVSLKKGGVPVGAKVYKHTSDFKRDFNAACVKDGHPELQLH